MQLKWVKLAKYLELSGDTRHAFTNKQRTGVFLRDREYRTCSDGRIWVNLEAVEQWAQKSEPRRHA
ncbi:hypothetical protein [Zooshikella sp. RANM57]|uniref:hypothetical protein n=1 Tax=Zooshikella sp. RANM57 TaxID=3425863 RepID=UPI003D6F8E97